jgi:UDPglucose--hexose-1-phosphate uridylyltransferase
MGAFIADIPPETAAARLREAMETAGLEPFRPDPFRLERETTEQPATEQEAVRP